MTTTKEHDERIATMTFASVYPHYVDKVEKKGRTVAELRKVIAWLTGFKAKDLQRLIKSKATFEQFFAEDCRICPVTIEIAKCSGVLRGRFTARGQQRTQADMLIAATAQLHQLTLVTRNIRDFEDCGVALLDPFS